MHDEPLSFSFRRGVGRARAPWFGAALLLGVTLGGAALRPAGSLSPRFNHVMLYVSQLEVSIDFYVEALGLEISQRVDTLTVLGDDGSETPRPVRMAFLRFPGQDFVLELSEQRVEGGGTSPLFQHLGVDVADIEAAAERVEAAGGTDFSGIRRVRTPAGAEARNAFFRGPDGERLELMQMVRGEF